MKLIITTASPGFDSHVDPRFGRGANFLIVDTDTLEWQSMPNPGVQSAGGAGIQAAQFVAQQSCDAVVSGDFGPLAHQALSAAGTPMYLFGDCRTPAEVIQCFKQNQLQRIDAPSRSEVNHSHKAR